MLAVVGGEDARRVYDGPAADDDEAAEGPGPRLPPTLAAACGHLASFIIWRLAVACGAGADGGRGGRGGARC